MPVLPVGQDRRRDLRRLGEVVAHHDQPRPARERRSDQLLAEALAGEADHRVGGGQDRLGRAVVPLSVTIPAGGGRLLEVQHVADRGGAEGVDRLGVVADDGQAPPVGLQRLQDRRLDGVGVLVLVDQDVVEPRARSRRDLRHGGPSAPTTAADRHSRAPPAAAWPRHSRRTAASARPPTPRTRESCRAGPVERCRGVDRVGVDREAGALLREAAVGPGHAQLAAHEVEQVGGVAAVEDGEAWLEPDGVGVLAQQSGADGVERPGPMQAAGEPGRRRARRRRCARPGGPWSRPRAG